MRDIGHTVIISKRQVTTLKSAGMVIIGQLPWLESDDKSVASLVSSTCISSGIE